MKSPQKKILMPTVQILKVVDLTGLLRDIKEDWGLSPPAGSRGGVPVGGLGDNLGREQTNNDARETSSLGSLSFFL